MFDNKILNEKIKVFIEINNLNITEKEYELAKKSYLFKDNELEIYLTNYKEDNTITLITINYWELKDNLNFPYELDKKYVLMAPVQKEVIIENSTNPIIPPKELENKKLVAFTFDDGPSKYTLEVLDILDEFNAKATFFVVGYNVKIRNSVVLELYNRGFELGNHTIDHSRLTKFNCEKANEKITQNNELVKNITNEEMILFRPPYGAINETLINCLNYPIILWSVDSRDWESRNTEMIIYEVLSNVEDGSIVLFHDLYPTTVEAIKLILPILYADNYEVVSVSELFNARGIPLENNKLYRKTS
ncbi:MAG: polysaccharide deacetylase family protein [Bacilli bacterium]|nr:polysaccharide deacetylase family protein [Bacilli bacterium]